MARSCQIMPKNCMMLIFPMEMKVANRLQFPTAFTFEYISTYILVFGAMFLFNVLLSLLKAFVFKGLSLTAAYLAFV